ncbi:MAG: hypothetical protein ACOC8D_02255 [bacterium]
MRILWIVMLAAMLGCVRAGELCVAVDGDDAHPGTKARPFASLARARDAAPALRQAGLPDGGVRVVLRGGRHNRNRHADHEWANNDFDPGDKPRRLPAVAAQAGPRRPDPE